MSQEQRPYARVGPREIYMNGTYTDYQEGPEVPGAEFGGMGIFVRSLVNAQGGPNLLAVHKDREAYAEPMDFRMPYGTNGANVDSELAALYGITQHRVAEINRWANAADGPRYYTAPRWTSHQMSIDPTLLIRTSDPNGTASVSGGVPWIRSNYNRQRYHAD